MTITQKLFFTYAANFVRDQALGFRNIKEVMTVKIKKTAVYQGIRSTYYKIKNFDDTVEMNKVHKGMKKFKDLYKGQKCFIIGNGPSLTIKDLEKIQEKGFKTFASNRIYLIYEKTTWRPDFYFMSDGILIKSDGQSDKLGVPMNNRFFPRQNMKDVSGGTFYNTFGFDYKHVGKFSKNAYEGVYQAGTITSEMIQIAYYMGFSEIYLIGVDFSYKMKDKSEKGDTYTYNNENNYFIQGYLKKGEVAQIPDRQANILGFEAAKKAVEEEGKIIKNATRGGMLEVFERIDVDTLLK